MTKPVLRDEKGHILPGSGPVNPTGQPEIRARRLHYMQLMDEAVSDEDITAIVEQAVVDAKKGNRFARDFIFEYLVGKPSVMQLGPTREAPMLKLMRTWLLGELANGRLEISELSGTLNLPIELEED